MAVHGVDTWPRAIELRDRILVKEDVSVTVGQLENQKVDQDARTLALLGKKQRLERTFGPISIIAFSTTLLASWESIACLLQAGLVNGGSASLVYGLIVSFIGSIATCASLAEMTSIFPTCGGQYHWVAELAPAKLAVSLSWAAGWITNFARISLTASAAYVAATEIQGLLIFNMDSYVFQRWHTSFFYWGVILVSAMVNIQGSRVFPHIETIAFIHHTCFFFVFLVPLVYLSPQSTAAFVFADFENTSGWSNNGISWGIGLLASAWAFVGIDGTSHMSEEVKDSAKVVPQSMMNAFWISGVQALGISIAILFSIGDLATVLSTPTQYPIIQIFYAATQSKPATTAIIVALMLTSVFSTFGLLASASRLTWSFAQDRGIPFSQYLEHVDGHYLIPVRAIVANTVAAMLLGFINIWSSTAFNALTSLSLIGHYTSYLLPISLMIWHRLGEKPMPYGPFKLGRWGVLINLVSIGYSIILLIFMVLPPYQPVTVDNMNYAGPIFGAMLLLGWVVWFFYGRGVYQGRIKDMIEGMHLQ